MALPTKPSETPDWATDATYSTGPDTGLITKVGMSSGEIDTGFIRGQRPPARKMNWLLHWICKWTGWAETALDNIEPRVTTNEGNITALQGDAGRVLSTNQGLFTSFSSCSLTAATPAELRYGKVAGDLCIFGFNLSVDNTVAGNKSFEVDAAYSGSVSDFRKVSGTVVIRDTGSPDTYYVGQIVGNTVNDTIEVRWSSPESSGSVTVVGHGIMEIEP